MTPALPALSPDDLRRQGHRRSDVLLISGDAYVDHPAFGIAVVARFLQSMGLVVAVAAQPDWRDAGALGAFGRPNLFVGISAGNMDSMVNHLTAHRKRRHDDAYAPGGAAGLRPNRAVVVYAQLARAAFPDALLVVGGIEASLRRFAHYDYWSDSLRRSVALDARADLLVYGMGERPLRAIVDRLRPFGTAHRGHAPALWGIRGTAFVVGEREVARRGWGFPDGAADGASLAFGLAFGPFGGHDAPGAPPTGGAFREATAGASFRVCCLPSFERLQSEPLQLAVATRAVERFQNPALATALVQRHGAAYVVAAPPAWPLTTAELDFVHELPYTRRPHPCYTEEIPAATMIATSVQTNRGCFGGCAFCAIGLHEGKAVQSRSRASVLREVATVASLPGFRGTVSDLGGPTANTWGLACRDPKAQARCRRRSCLFPHICPLLATDQRPFAALLSAAGDVPGVKHVFVASGLRHDLLLRDPAVLRALVRHHIGGHLHVAPEHSDPTVLRLARKPGYEVFTAFQELFARTCQKEGRERYLNPYFVSGLPGSTDARMADLVRILARDGFRPRQVQSFLPTPGTAATAMFYCGVNVDDPDEAVPVARTLADKLRQHALLTAGLPSAPPPAGGDRAPASRSVRRKTRPPR